MDDQQFDRFARWLATSSSRRQTIRSGLGFVAVSVFSILGSRSTTGAARTCGGPNDAGCGLCGVCVGGTCVPNSNLCGFCGACGTDLRCRPANNGATCSGCGICRNGVCRAEASQCKEPCERCRTAANGTPVCVAKCPDGTNCCSDGSCIQGDACCPGSARCGETCCPEGTPCTFDGCCNSDGDTVCMGIGLTLCCHSGQACHFNTSGTPYCCSNFEDECNGECCNRETQVCCGNACCESKSACLKDGYCCQGEICTHPNDGTQRCCGAGEVCCNGVCAIPADCCSQCGVCSTCDESDPAHPKCVPIPAKTGSACGGLGCGGRCKNGACDQIDEGEPCLNGQTCCGGQCRNSCGACDRGFHECTITNFDNTVQSTCCENAQPCCAGNIFVKCGPNPQTGTCCPDKTQECGRLCCPAGTLCDIHNDNAGHHFESCCPDGQSPCNGGCCPAGQSCNPASDGSGGEVCR